MEEWYDEDENEPLFHDEYERRVGKLSEDTKDLVDEIEREGIERGKNVAKTADIIIEMIDATNPKRIDFTNMNIKREDGVKIISVVNKSDTLYFWKMRMKQTATTGTCTQGLIVLFFVSVYEPDKD